MTISSRTPEGPQSRCPICNSNVQIDPSILFGDATCPVCGSLLWFLHMQSHLHILEHSGSRDVRERVIAIMANQLGVDPSEVARSTLFLNGIEADSLDMTELVMELEEEFDAQEPSP